MNLGAHHVPDLRIVPGAHQRIDGVVCGRIDPVRFDRAKPAQTALAELIKAAAITAIADILLELRIVEPIRVCTFKVEEQVADPEIAVLRRRVLEPLANAHLFAEVCQLLDLGFDLLVAPVGARLCACLGASLVGLIVVVIAVRRFLFVLGAFVFDTAELGELAHHLLGADFAEQSKLRSLRQL